MSPEGSQQGAFALDLPRPADGLTGAGANGNGAAGGEAPDGEARGGPWRDLLNALPAAIYTTDADGRITFFNPAAAAFWAREPALGVDAWCGSWRLYWPDGTPMRHDQCPMALALKEDREIRGAEAMAERPDGTRVPFLAYPTPLRDDAGRLTGAVNMLVDITSRKTAEAALREREARLRLLAREVDHRAKNLLATVQALVRMTRGETVPAYADSLMGRIFALSRAHTLLAESRWTGADFLRLAEEELSAYGLGEAGRVRIAGPRLALGAAAAQGLAMVLHELTTNAAKYGALSAPGGHVALDWSRAGDGGLLLRWTETGGPPVRPPGRRGFGTGLIEATVRGQLEGTVRFDWRPEGLACRIGMPARAIRGDGDAPAVPD